LKSAQNAKLHTSTISLCASLNSVKVACSKIVSSSVSRADRTSRKLNGCFNGRSEARMCGVIGMTLLMMFLDASRLSLLRERFGLRGPLFFGICGLMVDAVVLFRLSASFSWSLLGAGESSEFPPRDFGSLFQVMSKFGVMALNVSLSNTTSTGLSLKLSVEYP
jgi:hypothetical protein